MMERIAWALFKRRPEIETLLARLARARGQEREALEREIHDLWLDEIDHHRE